MVQFHGIKQHGRGRDGPNFEHVDDAVRHALQYVGSGVGDHTDTVNIGDKREWLIVVVFDPVSVRANHEKQRWPVQHYGVESAPNELRWRHLRLCGEITEIAREVDTCNPNVTRAAKTRDELSVGTHRHGREWAIGQLLVLHRVHVNYNDAGTNGKQHLDVMRGGVVWLHDSHAVRRRRQAWVFQLDGQRLR